MSKKRKVGAGVTGGRLFGPAGASTVEGAPANAVVADRPGTRVSPWMGMGFALLGAALIGGIWIAGGPESVRTAEANPAVASASAEVPGFRTASGYLPDDEMLGFVEVPSGTFLMGSDRASDPLAFDNELWPAGGDRLVEVPTFYVGRFEVTVAQYQAFVAAAGHAADRQGLAAPPTFPATSVSWIDAVAYAEWLDGMLRTSADTPPAVRSLLEQGWHVALPTEAQWEKAARGTDGRIYPWGDRPDRQRANFASRGPAPVGTFACGDCPHGLVDMSGNVWEWTRTPFRQGGYGPTSADRPNLEADALWVMRGGSFGDNEQNVRAAIRGGADPSVRRPFIGFRLVLTHDEDA
jgi:formylglycine-generating enzyme required for sulfatase activity